MKFRIFKSKKKKERLLDVLAGLALGIILTFIFIKYVSPAIKSSENKQNNANGNAAVQTGTTTISDSPYLGDKTKAKVAIVEFSDFECPYCQAFYQQTFDQIVSQYVNTNKIIFVYRDFLGVGQPAAEVDANAALCVKSLADNQTYFQMAKLIYQNTGLEGQGIATDKMVTLASGLGVSKDKFTQCLSSDQFKNTIQKDTDDGNKIGVTGTPSFVIGKLKSNGEVDGELIVGAEPFSSFQTTIDKYLK
ncbi:MAG: thioredoxin domain-containing protein [Patescibacteria group bacterium]|jgi:protein-disulfide isomerase